MTISVFAASRDVRICVPSLRDFPLFARARTLISPQDSVTAASFHTLPDSLFSDLSTNGCYIACDSDSVHMSPMQRCQATNFPHCDTYPKCRKFSNVLTYVNCRDNLTPLCLPPKFEGVFTYVVIFVSVGIATDYGLDGPGIETRWGEIFRPSRPALRPTQPPVQWAPGLSRE